jgi:hypothetical protein
MPDSKAGAMLGEQSAVAVWLPMATNLVPASQDRARIADDWRALNAPSRSHQRILHALRLTVRCD